MMLWDTWWARLCCTASLLCPSTAFTLPVDPGDSSVPTLRLWRYQETGSGERMWPPSPARVVSQRDPHLSIKKPPLSPWCSC